MPYTAKAIILGCGSSGGVPRVDGHWGACNPNNPKNYRTRCSLFVSVMGKNIIIDTSPDMRHHVLRENITTVDYVLFTHDHADQTHGIDDIRAFTFLRDMPVSAFADPYTAEVLTQRFRYIFHSTKGSGYPAIMTMNVVDGRFALPDSDIIVENFICPHGKIDARGFIIGDMAYSPDVHHLSDDTLSHLASKNLSVWVVDCLRYTPHPTHAHFAKVIDWHRIVKPKRMILTNLHFDLDYDELSARLPVGIKAAFDGFAFDFKTIS